MSQKYNLTGQKFGRLTALYIVPNNNYHTRWHCVCDCGRTKDVLQQNLCNGHVRSCGCLLVEVNREKLSQINASMDRESHNETDSRLYHIWIGIKARCFNPANTSYPNYGGRGISVCNEWKTSYLAFKQWAENNGYSDLLTIDRIDVNGNYSPDNCRWVSMSVQEFNKRTSMQNTSGITGVSFNKKQNRWVAYITKDHIQHHLGTFASYNDAINARKEAEIKFFG